ncbi:unnamed protein product [Caenorhabditis sp. 36 PRJEB53466]|nr:unnamed protein product [Caenorhabditis sp. 36 PRJEB53466]
MQVSRKPLLFLLFVLLILSVSFVDSQRFVDVMMARNEELNGLLGNSRRYGNTNAPILKRNSLLDNLYNIGYYHY